MIERNIRDQASRRLDGIDGIQAAAHADFEYRRIEPDGREDVEGGESPVLEIGQWLAVALRLDMFEARDDFVVTSFTTADAYPLVVASDMRRQITADSHACLAQQRL